MLRQVLATIEKYRMFAPGDRVLVAVSGGPDSMALLHVLKGLQARLCLELFAAHFDHGVRKGSGKDLDLVREECVRQNIPLIAKRSRQRPSGGRGFSEDSLRRLRYDFLLEAAAKCGAKKIAVGHTKDDQAETILMRLLRGSGLYGLSAILPKRRLQDREIVRPLIEASRKDVLRFLEKHNVLYAIDETNFEDRFLRNRVRGELLPLLEKRYNPAIRDVLSAAALSVGADYDLLSRQARSFLEGAMSRAKAALSVSENDLKGLDVAVRRLAYRHMIADLKGDLRRIAFHHIEELDTLLFSMPERSQVHLPSGFAVVKKGKRLHFIKR